MLSYVLICSGSCRFAHVCECECVMWNAATITIFYSTDYYLFNNKRLTDDTERKELRDASNENKKYTQLNSLRIIITVKCMVWFWSVWFERKKKCVNWVWARLKRKSLTCVIFKRYRASNATTFPSFIFLFIYVFFAIKWRAFFIGFPFETGQFSQFGWQLNGWSFCATQLINTSLSGFSSFCRTNGVSSIVKWNLWNGNDR